MITTEAWRSKGHLNRLNGFDVFHVEDGTADSDTLLLIHGFPTASWDWHAIWPDLLKNYRLIAIDMPGFGFSEKPQGHEYRITEQADTVEALVEFLGLENFHVLAHDYGDTVAQELLARQNAGYGTGQWQSCCFLNGGLFPEQHRALLIQKLLLGPLGPLVNRAINKKRFAKSVASTFGKYSQPSDEEIDAFWKLVNYNNGKSAFTRLIHYIKDRKTYRDRWLAALTEAKIPLALINGSSDPVSGAHMVAHYRNVVGEPAYTAELSAIGHYPQIEAPQEVVHHYLEFTKSLHP